MSSFVDVSVRDSLSSERAAMRDDAWLIDRSAFEFWGETVDEVVPFTFSEPNDFPKFIQVVRGVRIHIRPRNDSVPEH